MNLGNIHRLPTCGLLVDWKAHTAEGNKLKQNSPNTHRWNTCSASQSKEIRIFFRQFEFQSFEAWSKKMIGNLQNGKKISPKTCMTVCDSVCLFMAISCIDSQRSVGTEEYWHRTREGSFFVPAPPCPVIIIVTVNITTTINLVLAPATSEDSLPWMWSCKCLGRHQLPAPACSSTAHPTGSLASPVPGFPLQANSCQTACYWLEKVGEILKSIWWSFNTLRFDQFQQAHRMIG